MMPLEARVITSNAKHAADLVFAAARGTPRQSKLRLQLDLQRMLRMLRTGVIE
jgi:hypothetical protein